MIYFECSLDFTNDKLWSVSKVDQLTGNLIKNIDVTSNPTKLNSELVINSNTLDYGVYRFYFKNGIYFYESAQYKTVSSEIETFIEIIPTGLLVFGFTNGVSYMSFGLEQEIEINPGLNSIDLDSIIQPSGLNYTFYCRALKLNDSNTYTDYSNVTELLYMGLNNNLMVFQNNDLKCIKSKLSKKIFLNLDFI
jgi:hypothetical protein